MSDTLRKPAKTEKRLPARNPKLGSTIRRLRRENGLTQARMAEQLGISAPYLNLIEHNQRNVTATLLLKLADLFGLQLADIAQDDDTQLLSDLMEAFGDPVFGGHDVLNTDIRDLVSGNPTAARAVLTLYDSYRRGQNDLATLADRLGGEEIEAGGAQRRDLPSEAVSDMIQTNGNHFPELESCAERIRAEAGIDLHEPFQDLVDYLETRFDGIRVVILPSTARHVRHGTVRRFDPVGRTLIISEMLDACSRRFQVAHQIGLLAAHDEIDALLDRHGLDEGEARALGRVALANYFAAALLMPYDRFLEAARAVRYDIEMLEHHFGASFEQVCHRLTTMQRKGAKGVPFHMVRVDLAGNMSKRFSGSGIRIPRHGSACPRWNVYAAFMTPGRIHTQLGRMPDGASFFCIARTVRNRGGGYGVSETYYSVGIGCAVEQAGELVYADGIDLGNPAQALPVGVACRICERMDCRQRAFPPMHHDLNINENSRGLSAYVTAR